MKKSLVITGLTLATIGTIGSASLAFAESDRPSMFNQDGLSTKIAETFNLNKDEVQKVIENYHKENMPTRMQDLTDEQQALVQAKLDELKPRLDEIRAITDQTARHEAMTTLRDEQKTWEEENNVQLPFRMQGQRHHTMMRNQS